VSGRAESLAGADPNVANRPRWIGRLRLALAFGLADPNTIVVALAGFLLRGGMVLLLVPSAVLPSVIGVAGITGVDAFGIDGHPTPWLFEIVAVISVVAAVWLLLAFLVGSVIDVWLIDAALGREGRATVESRPLPALRILLDLATVRIICLVPVVVSIAWASSRLYAAAYNELTTPTNLVTPLAVRVVESAADAVLVVLLAWLASEVVAAIAVRRIVLFDVGVWRSIAGALAQLVRRPVSSARTVVVSFGTSVAAIGVAMAATAIAFDWCRVAGRNGQPISITIGVSPLATTRDFRPAVFVVAVVVLAAAWVGALVLSGVASAWRSAVFTGEVLAAQPAAREDAEARGLGLSGQVRERSGD
jgi:hypothetical protein